MTVERLQVTKRPKLTLKEQRKTCCWFFKGKAVGIGTWLEIRKISRRFFPSSVPAFYLAFITRLSLFSQVGAGLREANICVFPRRQKHQHFRR